MDLQTLGNNVDSGAYATKEEFYADAALIAENAVAFNTTRPNSGWVVALAKKFSGLLEREKKKAERRSVTMAASAAAAEAAGGEKKKIKLTLKRSSSQIDVDDAVDESSSAAASTSKKAKTGKKIKLKLNRGTQLQEGVSSTSSSKKSTTHTAPSNTTTTLEDFTKVAPMNSSRKAQCCKVLSSLKRRQSVHVKHFLKPMSDPKFVKDYKARIEVPMDLGTISSK